MALGNESTIENCSSMHSLLKSPWARQDSKNRNIGKVIYTKKRKYSLAHWEKLKSLQFWCRGWPNNIYPWEMLEGVVLNFNVKMTTCILKRRVKISFKKKTPSKLFNKYPTSQPKETKSRSVFSLRISYRQCQISRR